MRFDLDDEQRAIKQAVHDLSAARYDAAAANRRDSTRTDEFWPELSAAGWTALSVPERWGGQGAGVLELSLVVEELGYALAPATFFGNAAAGLLVAASQHEEHRQRWLPGIASGERRAAFGQVQRDGAGLALDAEGAAIAVLAFDGDALVVDPVPAGLEVADGIDLTRRVHRIAPRAAEPLHVGQPHAVDCVEILIAAELVGVAQHAMEMAVEFAKQRQQFGRPIGAYQAVSHRCADMLVLVESARSAVLSAAWTADHEPSGLPFAASVAKVAAVNAAWHVAASALQVHGGMGFTWEHPIHLFLRRASASSRLLGSADQHLDRVAGLTGLGGSDHRTAEAALPAATDGAAAMSRH
ncbi:MAG TPA: acyl-CoA dehydrogenase family protein [Candidatus Acidoferrales bacterium]|jgi:alkylation response protein AidB-like acyl-CoA dehydrogenase|nr:acyl-CoA dehydrogenase family protein [Candidatus Acidoferrales bacterium]